MNVRTTERIENMNRKCTKKNENYIKEKQTERPDD